MPNNIIFSDVNIIIGLVASRWNLVCHHKGIVSIVFEREKESLDDGWWLLLASYVIFKTATYSSVHLPITQACCYVMINFNKTFMFFLQSVDACVRHVNIDRWAEYNLENVMFMCLFWLHNRIGAFYKV